MRAFDTTAALEALLFILLVAAASANDCLGYCSGMYMCGFSYCYCPAAATKSRCPYPCFFTESGDCDGGSSSSFSIPGDDDDGTNSGAIACLFLVVLVAGTAMYYYVILPQEIKGSSGAAPKTAIPAVVVAQKAPTLDDVKEMMIQPDDGNKAYSDAEQAAPPLNDVKKTTIEPEDECITAVDVEQVPFLDDVKETTIKPDDGTKAVEIDGKGQE
jgi:hypothetical protein